jgi:serine protease AprX
VTSARALLTHAPTTWDKDLTGACGQADPVADLAWYTCISGTSQAAPHVAGTMALMEEAARCDLTPDQLFTLVSATAAPMPGRGEWEVGAGFLDARAAVDRVRADRRKLCRPRRGRIGEDRRP